MREARGKEATSSAMPSGWRVLLILWMICIKRSLLCNHAVYRLQLADTRAQARCSRKGITRFGHTSSRAFCLKLP